MLTRSVTLDPSYAPAFNAIAKREYYDAAYSNGGSAARERARAADEKALQIDPNFTEAAAHLVILRVEASDLAGALDDATRILRLRPDSARAHFTLGYVLRYAGELASAARECDAALALDRKDPGWRSCALAFVLLGDYEHALDYLRLDAGSQWATIVEADLRLRQGKTAESLALVRQVSGASGRQSGLHQIIPCLEGRPLAESDSGWRDLEALLFADPDPEPKYFDGARAAYCGNTAMALRLLRRSVEENFLVLAAGDRDPLLSKIRGTPEYAAIRALAIEKQKKLAARAR